MDQQDQPTVKLIERVRVVKTDLDHPERPPEIVERESEEIITLDQAALLGFIPGQGFLNTAPAHHKDPPCD